MLDLGPDPTIEDHLAKQYGASFHQASEEIKSLRATYAGWSPEEVRPLIEDHLRNAGIDPKEEWVAAQARLISEEPLEDDLIV